MWRGSYKKGFRKGVLQGLVVLSLKVDVDVCGFGFRVFGKHRVWLQGFEKGLSVAILGLLNVRSEV